MKVYDVATVLDAGHVRRKGVHAERDDRANTVHGMEDRGCQADTWLGVGLRDRGSYIRVALTLRASVLKFLCVTSHDHLVLFR